MSRESSMDWAITILVIVFCPVLLILPLIAVVWILAPYFVEQWKEDWKAERDRRNERKWRIRELTGEKRN